MDQTTKAVHHRNRLQPTSLVVANRELIERFEKKIQATLARVWGEDENHEGNVVWPKRTPAMLLSTYVS